MLFLVLDRNDRQIILPISRLIQGFTGMMSIHFTVAICTYNGAVRFPQVLDRLHCQIGIADLSWEILIVDNNSTDSTQKVVQHYQATYFNSEQLRYCFEPEQGLAIARQRAVTEARGEWVGFLDDDNVPDENWVANAYAFGQAHPQSGAYGSRIYGNFEVPPPENFKRISALLALTDRGTQPLLYPPQKKLLPPGAGLVVRKQAWLESVPARCFLQGRFREPYLPGEDLEALIYIQNQGWEVWYNPAMEVVHQIPGGRLERDYLLKLCRGIGLSRYHTRMLKVQSWRVPFLFLLYVLSDLYRTGLHLYRYRGQVKHDLVTACELELLIGSLLSPSYLWKAYFKDFLQRQFLSKQRAIAQHEPASP